MTIKANHVAYDLGLFIGMTDHDTYELSRDDARSLLAHIDAQAAKIAELDSGFNSEALAQEERAELAEQRVSELEEELEALRAQEPFATVEVRVGDRALISKCTEWHQGFTESGTIELFAQPVPIAPVALPDEQGGDHD